MKWVRSPRNSYFNVKRVRNPRDHKKIDEQYFEGTNGQYSQRVCREKDGSQHLKWPQRGHGAGFEIPSVCW